MRSFTKESIDTTRGPMEVRERDRCGDDGDVGDDGDAEAEGAGYGAI